jgi:hypothetical protein
MKFSVFVVPRLRNSVWIIMHLRIRNTQVIWCIAFILYIIKKCFKKEYFYDHCFKLWLYYQIIIRSNISSQFWRTGIKTLYQNRNDPALMIYIIYTRERGESELIQFVYSLVCLFIMCVCACDICIITQPQGCKACKFIQCKLQTTTQAQWK